MKIEYTEIRILSKEEKKKINELGKKLDIPEYKSDTNPLSIIEQHDALELIGTPRYEPFTTITFCSRSKDIPIPATPGNMKILREIEGILFKTEK